MEHRWSARLPVCIRRGGGRALDCHTDDINLEGAFLRVRPDDHARDLRLRRGVPLAIEFTFSGSAQSQSARFELSGIVMHCCAEGAGVMFRAPAQQLLHAARSQATREVSGSSTADALRALVA